jgi:hypothetical protein
METAGERAAHEALEVLERRIDSTTRLRSGRLRTAGARDGFGAGG